MLEIAAFESKLKMLDEEILRVTRRTRVLDERVLPRVAGQIKTIVHYYRAVLNTWRDDYNHHRPHGSLGRVTPSEFAARGQKTDPEGPEL